MQQPRPWWILSLAPDGAGGPADEEPDERAPADALAEQIADGELLAREALRSGVAVAAADLLCLLGAREQAPALRSDDTRRLAFVEALARVVAAHGAAVGAVRANARRVARLRAEGVHVRDLLYFAAAQGRPLEDDLVHALVGALAAAEAGEASEAQEQAFLQAYRVLAGVMSPVSGRTLRSSVQRLPRVGDLLAQPRRFLHDLRRVTIGRFLHFALFTLVLLAAGVAIGYQTVGAAAFERHRALDKRVAELITARTQADALVRDREREWRLLDTRGDARADEVALAGDRKVEAEREIGRLDDEIGRTRAAGHETTRLLGDWAGQPCRRALLAWACGLSLTGAQREPSAGEIVFDAEMALNRLNLIVLPMLLGLLGAYAFVLRTVSREIRDRSFSEHSALHHLARLSLGALAGIAVGWFLKPEQIGLLNNVPAWVMAFVAGYGIELLFTFLDRIVGAFTSQQAKG